MKERNDIRDFLYLNRIPITRAAEELRVSVSMVSHRLKGRCTSQRIEDCFTDMFLKYSDLKGKRHGGLPEHADTQKNHVQS